MRVAMLAGHAPQPSETFITQQIEFLRARGHCVDLHVAEAGRGDHGRQTGTASGSLLAGPPFPAGMVARLAAAGAHVARYSFRDPVRMMRALLAIPVDPFARSLRLLFHVGRQPPARYDLLHAHFGPNGIRGASLRRIGLLRGPLLTSFHGYDVNVVPRLTSPGIYRRLFLEGDLFSYSSDFVKRRLLDLGAPSSRLVRIPVGVDPHWFRFRPRRGAESDRVKLISVARLVEVKGIARALRAVARLARTNPGVSYEVIGDGPLREELERLAQESGIGGRVRFRGWCSREEVRSALDAADLFLLPGIVGSDGAEEGQGLALLEAQMCGLPVLSTRVGGIPESVLDGESGLLVESPDEDALFGALSRLVGSPQRWAEMGAAGRAFVESKFGMDSAHDALLDAYALARSLREGSPRSSG